jgi:membrane-associated HD superfamily phosphohydrolase
MFPLKPFISLNNCGCTLERSTFAYVLNQFVAWFFVILIITSVLMILATIFSYIRNKKNGEKLISPIFIWALGIAINLLGMLTIVLSGNYLNSKIVLLAGVIGGIMILIWGITLKGFAGKKKLFWFLTILYWFWILCSISNVVALGCFGRGC